MTTATPPKTPSTVERILMGADMPLIPKIALFMLFTVLLAVGAFVLLPWLVVLGPWGYVAAFVINILSSASVVIPGPGFTAVMIMARDLDPILLGVAAGIGGTIGELTGYWLGAQGRDSIEGNRVYDFILKAMTKVGGIIILLFGLMPFLPVDAAGLLAGASRYPLSRFLFYLGVGKVAMSVILLYLTAQAFKWAEPYLAWLN